ncbi:MAG: isopenicillin N synthase family oxygenase, partial [Hyphomonadaceae bacterium]
MRAGLPLHGGNLFPESAPALREAVTAFMRGAEQSALAIMEGMALSLGLDAQYFRRTYTSQPT